MQLHGTYTSPYVRHCRIVVAQENVNCGFVETTAGESGAYTATLRVPFLVDGDLQLNDSLSIIRHLRAQNDHKLFRDASDLDFFCTVNTALDTAVNIFQFERDGIITGAYLDLQRDRLAGLFHELNEKPSHFDGQWTDAWIRLACLLGWVRFRDRYDVSQHPSLECFLAGADRWSLFAETTPPKA